MKNRFLYVKLLLLSTALSLLTVVTASSTIIGGSSGIPNYSNDDGTSLFYPGDLSLSVELGDLPGAIPGLTSNFGFYFDGSDVTQQTNRITVFSDLDQGPPLQSALINFQQGWVFDVDEGSVESLFVTQSSAIGFYLTFGVAGSEITVFSDPLLNTGGADWVGAFPHVTKPEQYLIGFENPITNTVLAFDVVTNVQPVPEPSTALLFCTGLACVTGLLGRKK